MAKAPAKGVTKKAAPKAATATKKPARATAAKVDVLDEGSPGPVSAATKNGAQSTGAASIRSGFGFDAEGDLLFALGWPHLRRLTADDPKTDPAAFALAAVERAAPPLRLVDWSREAAHRYVRALATAVRSRCS